MIRAPVVQELSLSRENKSSHILLKVAVRQTAKTKLKGFILTFDDITDLVSAQRNAAWGDVARRIAHEIKNPLTPIKLSAERLKKKFLPSSNGEHDSLKEYADMIIRQTEVLQRIVDEFSKFARMPEPQKTEIYIGDLINSAVLLQRTVYPKIEFNITSKVTGKKILADPRMITQALMNLLKNAAESVVSSVQNQKEKLLIGIIDITLTEVGDSLMITVLDTGLGLDSKQHNYFEPYVTTKKNGTGLGLAIVRKIIEQHDGTLKLYNAKTVVHAGFDKGAIAEIKVPILQKVKTISDLDLSGTSNKFGQMGKAEKV